MSVQAQNRTLCLINELGMSPAQISEFCQRWKVSELALFGSALRSDFRADSDVDILVVFSPEANWSLLDHIRMQEEFGEMIDRRVDLVSKRAVQRSENWMRRNAILDSAEVIYASSDKLTP